MPPAKSPPPTQFQLATDTTLTEFVTSIYEKGALAVVDVPDAWLLVLREAKTRDLIREEKLTLTVTEHGRMWLEVRRGKGNVFTQQKITRAANHKLGDLSRETGVPMQEAIGLIITTMHEHRERLTRYAFAHGGKYPWDAIAPLLKAAKAK